MGADAGNSVSAFFMPAGTKVETLYEALRRQGYSKGKSARIAQSKTGLALATGKPPKDKEDNDADEKKPKQTMSKSNVSAGD